MKRFIVPALLLISASAFGFSTYGINQFGGNNSDDSPLLLKNGQTPDSMNCVTDEPGGGLIGRMGYIQFSTYPANAMWSFPTSGGTNYFIVHSGNKLLADTGTGKFTTVVSTVAAGIPTVAASLGDKFFWSNTIDGLHSWDGSTAVIVSSTIKCTSLVNYVGRLWCSGDPASARTIKASAYGDGADWTLQVQPADDAPAQFVVGGANDEIVTGMHNYRDSLAWFKQRSFGLISGFDRSDFSIHTISDVTGTAYIDTVQDCAGYLRFLGPLRTTWEWDGANLTKISEGINNLMGTIVQGDFSSRSFTLTSEADWEAGTVGSGLTTTSSPGDLEMSTGTLIDNFSDGNYTVNPPWMAYSFGVTNPSFSAASGDMVMSGKITPGYGGYADMALGATITLTSSGYWETNILAQDNGSLIPTGQTDISVCDGALPNTFVCDPLNDRGYAVRVYQILGVGGVSIMRYDRNGTQGTLLLGCTPYYAWPEKGQPLDIGISINNGLISAFLDGELWCATNDTTYTSFSRIGLNYFPSSTVYETTETFTEVDSNSMKGNWVSSPINVGSISSWGIFGADDIQPSDVGEVLASSSNITYAIYGDSNTAIDITNPSTYISSQTITSGTMPTISTAAYVVLTSSFSRTNPFLEPVLHSLTIQTGSGSALLTPSGFPTQRYWVGVSIGGSSNNRVLVYDRKRQWQLYDIPMDAMTIWNGNYYFANTSGIFQAESGYQDNGSEITSHFKTAQYAPAGLDLYSTFDEAWITTDNSPSTLSTTFYLDGVNSPYTMGSIVMNAKPGTQNRRLPFSFSYPQQGKYIQLRWSVTGSNFWRLLNGNLYFVPDAVPTGG